jgi:hypothetical protein
MNILKTKKGIALLWAIVMATILMLVAGTMISFVIKDSQGIVRIEDSVKAYSAAKSGMDWALTFYHNQETPPTSGSYSFTITDPADPNPANVWVTFKTGGLITSLGEYNNSQREVEYKVAAVSSTPVADPNDGLITTGSNFRLQFDYWFDEIPDNFTYGFLDPNATGNRIYIKNIGTNGDVALCTLSKCSNTIKIGSQVNPASNINKPYFFRAKIDYTSSNVATLTVSARSAVGAEKYTDLGVGYLDPGFILPATKKMFATPSAVLYTDANPDTFPNSGDGGVLEILDSTGVINVFIDHVLLSS